MRSQKPHRPPAAARDLLTRRRSRRPKKRLTPGPSSLSDAFGIDQLKNAKVTFEARPLNPAAAARFAEALQTARPRMSLQGRFVRPVDFVGGLVELAPQGAAGPIRVFGN
jgi:3-methyladenine DNA glycosylase Mpg